MVLPGANLLKILPAGAAANSINGLTKHEWLNGWNVTPDASINKKEFAVYYFKNKERWDKAFAFLKDNDLTKLGG